MEEPGPGQNGPTARPLRTGRVLVVDDSAFMRRAITRMVESDPCLRVVGTARNGRDALTLVRDLQPDLVTLDIQMPIMDGLECVQQIMAEMPRPVIMLSTVAVEGADATLQALSYGAFDFVTKPGNSAIDVLDVTQELVAKIKAALKLDVTPVRPRATAPLPPLPPLPSAIANRSPVQAVLIGVSTGGPPLLQELVGALPGDFPVGIVIVQHMPAGFTRSLAERLDRQAALHVKEAEDGELVARGKVLIAPAGVHLILVPNATGGGVVRLSDNTRLKTWHKPSVDGLMTSGAAVYGTGCLGVVLTGMGSDGTMGLTAIRREGGRTWAQDEASSIIYGMPKAARDAGVVDRVLPAAGLAGELVRAVTAAPVG